MPLYDYQCSKCGSVFEVRQKFDDALLTEHEGCGGKVERLLSAPALQFKGTGFYITDYKNNSNSGKPSSSKSESSSSSETKSESTKSDSAKSESKPASTPTKSE